ncbi:MAG: AAA family ATPase, partial [Deltaproteobacteria bacterium]|nr:AAA family ATPase [Deltaproteobacteria bacterium]
MSGLSLDVSSPSLQDLPNEGHPPAFEADDGSSAKNPDPTLEEFRKLIGSLVTDLLRDAGGALDLSKIPAKDFGEFKTFIQDQAAQNDGMSFRNPYESLLKQEQYEPLLKALWENRSISRNHPFSDILQDLFQRFQSDFVGIDADRFVQREIGTAEGRTKLRRILGSSGYFSKDRKSDLVKAIAKAGDHQKLAVDYQIHGVTNQISTWNIFNLFVSDEDLSKATEAAQEILDSAEGIHQRSERIRKKEARGMGEVSLLSADYVGRGITIDEYRAFEKIAEEKSQRSDPVSKAQAQLASLWLLAANQSNWSSEDAGSQSKERGHVIREVEALYAGANAIKTEADFVRFTGHLKEFLHSPISGMATVEEGTWQRTQRQLLEEGKFHLGLNGLPQVFAAMPSQLREPYDQLVQSTNEWSASMDMGETIRISNPGERNSDIAEPATAKLAKPSVNREDLREVMDAGPSGAEPSDEEKALRQLIDGLEHAKHQLWAGYKQHKAVSRMISAAADQIGAGDRQDIRKANQFLDQAIAGLGKAKSKLDVEAEMKRLYQSLQKDGLLYRAYAAAEMDGIEQALGLIQSAAIAIGIGMATKGLGTVAQVDMALFEASMGLTATRMISGFGMGMATTTAENLVAIASRESRQGPETAEAWFKDAMATGLSMSITGALPASQAAHPSLLKNLWARYAMGGLSGGKHLVLDTLAETVEEGVDQVARQAMDGNTHGLSLNEWRELASISALGGGAKVGAVAEAIKGSKAMATRESLSPTKSDWRHSPLITHPLGNLLMAPLGLFLGVGGGAFFGPQFKKKLTIDRKTLSEMEAFSRTKVKGDGEDHAVFFGLNHLKWWLSLVYRDIETLGARAIFQGGAILFARWQGKSENRKKTEAALTALAEEAKFSVKWKAPTAEAYWQELWEKSRVENPKVAASVLQQLRKDQAPLAQNWLEALAQNDFDRSEEIRKIMKGEEIRLSVASPPRLKVDNVDSLNSSIAKAYDKAWTAASLEETLSEIAALKKQVEELHFLPEEKLSGEPIAEQKPAAPIPVGRVSTALHPHAARFIELSFGHDKASSEQIEEWIAAEGPRLQAISRAVQGYIKKVLGVEGWERYFVKARRQWARAAKVHSGSDIQSLYIARVISSLEDGSWVYQHPDNLDPWQFARETSAAGLLINQGVEPALRNVWNRGASEYAYLMSAHLAKVLAEDIAAQKALASIPIGPVKAPLHPLAATLINKVFGHDEASANKIEAKIAAEPPRFRVIPRALQGYIKKTLGVEGWEQYFVEARSDFETATKDQSQPLAESHKKARLISSLEDGSWVYEVPRVTPYGNEANLAAEHLHSEGLEFALKCVWDRHTHANVAALNLSAHLAKLVAELIRSNNAPAKGLTSQFTLQPGLDYRIGADANRDIPIRNMGLKKFHLQENLKTPADTYFDTLPKRDLATIPEEFRHLIPKPKDIVLFKRFKEILDETASLLSAPERIAVRFFGPPGTAKTTIPEMIAQQMGVPLLRFPFSKFTDPSDIDGQWNLQEINGEESVIFEEGPATLAMEHGFHLVWDEPDLARPGTLAYANNISAPGATAWVRGRDGNLRRIEVHPGFRVLATENGVTEIGRDEHGKDFLRRFVPYHVGPWTQEEVVEVLTQTFESYGGRRRWSHKVTETLALFHEQMRKLAAGGRDPKSGVTLTPLGSGVGQTLQFTPRSVLRLAQRLLASGGLTAEGLARALRSEYILPLALEEDRRLVWDQVKALFSVLRLGDIGPESIPQPTLESLSKKYLGGRKIQKNHFVWTPQDLRLADEILWNKSLGIDVMLLGEAGEGKTELPPQIAKLLQLPYFQKSISRETEESDLVGGPGREGKKIVFKPDVVTLATEQGGLLHLDECLLGDTAKIEAVFNPLMDGTQALILKHPYRMIPRHQDAFFVFTSNPPFGEFADRYEYSGALQSRMATIYLTGEFAKQPKDRLDILEGYLEGLEGNARSLPSATRLALRLSREVGRSKTTLRFIPLVPNQVARDRFQVPELLAVEIGPAAIREIDAEGRLIPLSAQSQSSLEEYASYLSRRTQADMASSGRVFQISYSVLGSNLTDFDTRGIQLNLSHVLELPLDAALGIGKHEYAHALIDGPSEKYDAHPWGQLYANAVGDPRMHE